jgi:CRISPR system Cascade subunit CasA
MMNLTRDPWIPALRSDGARALFSLQDLFERAHEIRDLAVKPHERVALMRLLLCITQAALEGPKDEADWESCVPRIQPSVKKYLDQWAKSFELFGDKERFLQLPNLALTSSGDEGSAATKLDLSLATGNNATLFDNKAAETRTLDVSRLALNLLASQCFATCGRIGVAQWNGAPTAGNGSCQHAPCAPSSMVHTIVLGASLLETLHLNLLTKQIIEDFFGSNNWGTPVWEQLIITSTCKGPIQNATTTYLGRLVPISRSIKIEDTGQSIIYANGLEYPLYPAFREPTSTVVQGKDKNMLLPGSTGRSFWRQLGAVSVVRKAKSDPLCGPLALQHGLFKSDITIWVGAMVTDKAKIEDIIESTYSVPAGVFSDAGRVAYEKGVAFATELEKTLIQSVKSYSSALNVESPPYDKARQRFWTLVEQSLGSLFDLARNVSLALELPSSPWGQACKIASRRSYESCCPQQTSRQIEAYALGLRRLNFTPKPSQPQKIVA